MHPDRLVPARVERLADGPRTGDALAIQDRLHLLEDGPQAGLDRVRPLISDLQQIVQALPSAAAAAGAPAGGDGASGDGAGDEEVVDAEFTRE